MGSIQKISGILHTELLSVPRFCTALYKLFTETAPHALLNSIQLGYTAVGDRKQRERTLFSWHHSNTGRAEVRVLLFVTRITQDLRTFTSSPVQMGLSDTGNATAWAAAAELRMSTSLLQLSHQCPQKLPVSPPDSVLLAPLCLVTWPVYNYRQKGCWVITEILTQYMHRSRDFSFFSN